ncbi:hypothetical protein RvY_02296 [Ramazzottius varieornatus]|uniref:Exonuclease domain-containing protein n=1 Tax=Ramazzottius varieornatus TaxID=947166 RepID=A0A1D1UMZ8_RAMVA|nr:hypothetical protein RvY_02296 [Ramazzottius varieornatus]
MFSGAGLFSQLSCPYGKNPSRSSGSAPSGTIGCGRPHCKYNHADETFEEEVADTTPNFPIAERSKEEIIPTFPSHDISQNHSISGHHEVELGERTESSSSSPVPEGISEVDLIPSGGSLPLFPNLEDSIRAIEQNGLLGRYSTPGENGEKPSYSNAPLTSADHNPYSSYLEELSSSSISNDMEYDPVSNWRVPFTSTGIQPVETPSEPTSSSLPSYSPSPNTTPSTNLQNNLLNNDVPVPLGRKSIASTGVSKATSFPHTQRRPGMNGLSQGMQASVNQPKRKFGLPEQAVGSSPVTKRARFAGRAPAESPVEAEKKPVKDVKPKKKADIDEAEVMKHLFGEDDDEDDDDIVELPVEMPAKPRGFPKDDQKLLEVLQAKTSAATAVPLSRPSSTPVNNRPNLVQRKKIATPQEQLETRRKAALEEQKKKTASASSSLNATGASVSAAAIASTAETVDKGAKRMAHQPKANGASQALPRIALVPSCKISTAFRQQVLERFLEHFVQITRNPTEAAQRSVQLEADIAKISFHIQTYRNKVTGELVKLKNAVDGKVSPYSALIPSDVTSSPSVPPSATPNKQEQKPALVFPKAGVSPQQQKQNFSALPVKPPQRAASADPHYMSDQDFYVAMKKHVLTEDDLVINGYPLIQSKKQDGENSRDGLQLYIAMSGKITPDRITQTKRSCCRCGREFTVDFEGNYAREEECLYHWGKAFSRRIAGEGVTARRNCCSDDSSSRGCCVAKCHVADTIPSLSGFVATAGVKPKKPEDRCKIYAIDCEMIYTVGGMELARVTIVDRHLHCIYETLVRPKQRIVDCNTRFSGLKIEMFSKETQGNAKNTIKTIEEVHKDLVGGIINEETILMGHSLESDLLSMKLIHRNIIDTSVVFPHRQGPPYKRALRNLMREYLSKIIQEDASGHDSREDAAACMELMIYKIRSDVRR